MIYRRARRTVVAACVAPILWLASQAWASDLDAARADIPAAENALKTGVNELVDVAIQRGDRIDDAEVSRRIDRYLAQVGWPSKSGEASRPQAESAFRMVSSAAAAAPSVAARLVDLMDRISASPEAEAMRPTVGEMAAQTYEQLLNARMFGVAREFAGRHGIQTRAWADSLMPPAIRTPGAQYLRFGHDAGIFNVALEDAGVEAGDWLIAEVHPDCGFSRKAMEYLARHPEVIAGIGSRRVIWLMSQRNGQALPSMLGWNASQGEFEMVLSYRDEQWPKGLSFLEFPVFNLFKDGKLVSKLQGWPGDSQGERLRSAILELQGQ